MVHKSLTVKEWTLGKLPVRFVFTFFWMSCPMLGQLPLDYRAKGTGPWVVWVARKLAHTISTVLPTGIMSNFLVQSNHVPLPLTAMWLYGKQKMNR